jgi:hypothetical protein
MEPAPREYTGTFSRLAAASTRPTVGASSGRTTRSGRPGVTMDVSRR